MPGICRNLQSIITIFRVKYYRFYLLTFIIICYYFNVATQEDIYLRNLVMMYRHNRSWFHSIKETLTFII